MGQEVSLPPPNFKLTESEFEAVHTLVCCFLDGSPLSPIHIVRSSYKPANLQVTRSLLACARVKMEGGHGTMEDSKLLQDEAIAICEIVAHFAQEYPQETATEIGGTLTQVPLPVILAALRSAVTKLAGLP